MQRRALVVGLGNPLLGDDGVGWRIADSVARHVADRSDVTIECAAVGGLTLMERLIGYDRVLIADAVHTGDAAVGTVRRARLEDLDDPSAGHTTSGHDTSLATALDAGRALGAALPTSVALVTVEVPANFEFSETLSPAVAAAVAPATRTIIEWLTEHPAPRSASRQEVGIHGLS